MSNRQVITRLNYQRSTADDSSALLEKRDELVQRLDAGWQAIGQAESQGKPADKYFKKWSELLEEYKRTEDKLRRQSRPYVRQASEIISELVEAGR